MSPGHFCRWMEAPLRNGQRCSFSAGEDVSFASLHGLGSDQLHLHMSALLPSTTAAAGHGASSGSDAETSQDSEPGRGRHVGAAPKAKQGSDSQQHNSSRGQEACSSAREEACSCRRGLVSQWQPQTQSGGDQARYLLQSMEARQRKMRRAMSAKPTLCPARKAHPPASSFWQLTSPSVI